jgi:hypothetical protein
VRELYLLRISYQVPRNNICKIFTACPGAGTKPWEKSSVLNKAVSCRTLKYTVFQIFKNFYHFRRSIFPPAGKPAFSAGFRSEIHSTLRQAAPFFALQESARRSDSGSHERQGGEKGL